MKKVGLVFFILLGCILSNPGRGYALLCGEAIPPDAPEGVLRDYLADCNNKIQQSKGQQATLSTAISYLNVQIGLTQAQILTTQKELAKLELEISDLSGKIGSINVSLDDLTRYFILRVRASYKNSSSLPFGFLLNQNNFSELVKQAEYLSRIRENDRNLLLSLEKSRLNLAFQKERKEEKQKEIESLRRKLSQEQSKLSAQKSEKDQLLAETRNDEKRYQALRAEAANRVAQLASYTASRGGASLLSGTTKCDEWGCYYNQRDSQWGSKVIGNSNQTVASVGCLVASTAMVASHYGKSLTPGDIASSTSPFEFDTADMRFSWSGSVNGTMVNRTPVSCSGSGCFNIIDSELNQGKPVIARITASNVAGTHFIVIVKKEGDNYIMKDPYEANGNNVNFASIHSVNSLTRIDKVSVL